MRILWVKAGKLLPVDTGGKIRSYNILRHLARTHEVSLLTYYGGEKDSSYEADILQEFPGAKTVWAASLGGSALAQSAKYLRSAFDPAPFAVTKFAYPTVRQAVVSLLGEKQFDVAVCDFLSASLNFPDVFSAPTVLFQHNVETALWRRMASAESNRVKRIAYQIEAGKMARYEKRTLERFQHIIAVSDHDRQQMLAMVPRCDISVIATGVDTQKYTVAPSATANPPRIVFTGSMDWEPNIDAVIYFCRDIFPRIRSEFPAAVFQIVGRDPHPRVQQLASQRVQVTGTVPFVGDYLRDATVVIVPLRIGGGTRLKIFEAMAMGKAVVSTSIGAEGLKVESGRDLILADDAASFADAVLRLIKDATLRQAYERAAAGLAVQFDWSNIAISFAQVLQKVSESETSNAPLPHSVP